MRVAETSRFPPFFENSRGLGAAWPLLDRVPMTSHFLRAFLTVGAVTLFAPFARAEEAPPEVIIVPSTEAPVIVLPAQPAPPLPPKTHEEWYGYQTLIADGASVAAMIGGASFANDRVAERLLLAGGLGYVFGGPIVHWMHGNMGPGFGSLGLRVGAPLVGLFWGAVIGAAADTHGSEADSVAVGSAIGFLGGMAGAMLVDAALLAYEKVPGERPLESAKLVPAKPPLRLVPQLSIGRVGGATVGLSGLF